MPNKNKAIESQANPVGVDDISEEFEPIDPLETLQQDAEEELHRTRGRYNRPARAAWGSVGNKR